MCKKKLGHKKLEKTTLSIVEGSGNTLAEFVTLDYFWSGQTNLVAKIIGSPGPIFKPGARRPHMPGFLKLILCGLSVCVFACVCVCVCVCVCPCPRLLITSGVI